MKWDVKSSPWIVTGVMKQYSKKLALSLYLAKTRNFYDFNRQTNFLIVTNALVAMIFLAMTLVL